MGNRILDNLNIGREIMDLYKQKIPVDEIRNRMINSHPEITYMPSLATFFRYIEDFEDVGEHLDDRVSMEKNYLTLRQMIDDYVLDATRWYNQKDKKELLSKERQMRNYLEEFHRAYVGKKKEVDDLLQNWGNVIQDELCGNCKTKVIPKLIKLIEKEK